MQNFPAVDPAIQARINSWLNGDYDNSTKNAIREMLKTHPHDVIDAFYRDLDFGTGGLRALMGPGSNRMNIYTIRQATQGVANYLLKTKKGSKCSVAIGFDSRHHSREFAHETARVFAGNGIEVFLFPEIRPTPYTSFACRHLKCQAAIMITASHNPKEYNGYKVYWSDGAQVVPPHDTGIIAEVEKISSLDEIKLIPFNSPLIHITDEHLDKAYLDAIYSLQIAKERNHSQGKHLKIAYTSLHGTGITLAPKALSSWGFSHIDYVEAQIIPDGDFPTVKFPNPEYPETLKMGIDLLTAKQSDLLLANDPDADRLGVVVLHKGKPVILTGNEIASICVDYLCASSPINSKDAFITTIVSTELIGKIAKKARAAYFEVLTGFKYIGEKIHEWEIGKGDFHFIFGAEESYGYLLGTVARDKDAIVSSCLIAEIAIAAKMEGKTLVDRLETIYETFGVHREGQKSLSFPPTQEGTETMKAMMHQLREHPPLRINDKKVLILEDYLSRKRKDLSKGTTEPLTLPVSDVLLFRMEDGSRLVIRPSGTEPKVKLYGSVSVPTKKGSVDASIKQGDEILQRLLASAEQDLTKK
jgi:phosphomannomutase